MLLATRVSEAPLAVVLGAEEIAKHKEQRREHEAKVKAGNPDRDSPACVGGAPRADMSQWWCGGAARAGVGLPLTKVAIGVAGSLVHRYQV